MALLKPFLRTLLVALVVTGCADVPDSPVARDAGADTEIDVSPADAAPFDSSTDVALDVGFDLRDATRDAADIPLDAGPPAADWVRLHLVDGGEVTGELVATYDTTRWWDTGEGLLYAIFDPTDYDFYPNDRSFRFVEAIRVASIDPWTPPPTRATYQQFLRNHDIAFQRPPLAETSWVITAGESYHLEENGFGDFAWDFVRTDDEGARYTGDGTQNSDYLVWDEPVFSGVAGEVIDVVQSSPDNIPGSHPEWDVAVNNWVGIALGGHFYAYYLHFRQDGVAPEIEVGSVVEVGDRLGRVGNSGVTLEPHMHVVLLWWDEEAQRSYSVPVEWHEVGIGEAPVGPFERYEWYRPMGGDWVRP